MSSLSSIGGSLLRVLKRQRRDQALVASEKDGSRDHINGGLQSTAEEVRKDIASREEGDDEEAEGCSIGIITWNMNAQASSCNDLVKLVVKYCDLELLVIGLQEAPRKKISKLLQDSLNQTHDLLGEVVMQSQQLYVFGRKSINSDDQLLQRTSEVEVDNYAAYDGCCYGVLQSKLLRRNKGAVGIRFSYKDTDMTFISCHLEDNYMSHDVAHAHNEEKRNSQLKQISNSLFSHNNDNLNDTTSQLKLKVWLGDLNYRIRDIESAKVRQLVHESDQNILIRKDQLLLQMERGEIFKGYKEGELGFKPTYKYDIGTSNYDTSYKEREPAWTDRILYKHEGVGSGVKLLSYESLDMIQSSDHKPVMAHLRLYFNKKEC